MNVNAIVCLFCLKCDCEYNFAIENLRAHVNRTCGFVCMLIESNEKLNQTSTCVNDAW